MDGEYDVVVVGAGVIGCAVADALAPAHDVLVIDRAGVAEGATGRAAGLVTPTLFYGDEPPIAEHANAFFRDFSGQYGFEFTERRRYDYVLPDEVEAARERANELAAAGFPVTYLDAEAAAAEAPRLRFDGFAGAVRYDDAGWVDPYELATALQRRATDQGATFELGEPVLSVTPDGIDLPGRRVAADTVVVAAGWNTGPLLDTPLPVRAYRTQCVVLEPTEPVGDDFPIGRVGSEHLYFRPEHNGDLLIGGAHDIVDDPAAASTQADEDFVGDVAVTIPDLVDGMEDAGLVTGWAGVDSATPDARPILDHVEDVIVATGFNGLGVLAAPIAATVVEHLVAGDIEGAPFDAETFALDRFDDSGATFTLKTTSDVGR